MIELNGKPYELEHETHLVDILQKFNYQLDAIIVKHNQDIVKFKQFNSVTVKSGDILKVFPFVGGG